MTSAYRVGDRMAMLNDGKVVFQGTIDETRNTTDPLVRQFIEGSREGPIRAI
jgi:phospholipid/cholesterol/gamma-HCH transport system ATP-binding protein